MKIVQISPYFPPHVGGVEYHVKELAEGLCRRGHQVSVASSCGRRSRDFDFISIPSVDLFYSPIPLRLPSLQADIYHSHIPSPLFAYLLRGARPQVVTYHNDVVVPRDVNGFALPGPLAGTLERIASRMVEPILEEAQAIVATTKSYAETSPTLRRHLDKVRIVPNAVNLSLYPRVEEKGRYVLYAGRILNYKGVGNLLYAMKEVQQSAPDLELVLVGEGYDRPRLERTAASLGVRAKFTGRLERSMFIDTISRAEVLVLPTQSRLEAFGIVLLEAMACKTPVLAFDTPGVNEVARCGGMVFSSRKELRDRILQMHEDEPLRKLLGERGRRAVEERYSWSCALDKMESVYRDAAERN